MNWKRTFLLTLCSVFLFYGFIFAFTFAVDPFELRSPRVLRSGLANIDYNPIIARNQTYDAAIVGTSMTQNFKPSDFKRLYGWNSLKFQLNAGTPREIGFLLETIIRQNKARRYLICLDHFTFQADSDHVNRVIREYLYDDVTTWRDYTALFEASSFFYAVRTIFSRKTDSDRIFSHLGGYSEKAMARQYFQGVFTHDLENFDPERINENFEANYRKRLDALHDKDVIVFFPPYSMLAYDNSSKMENAIVFKRKICNLLFAYPNIRIVDFQADTSIIGNFDNYRDPSHYSPKVCTWMAENVFNENYLVTSANLDSMLEHHRDVVRAYDFEACLKRLREIVKE